MLVALLAAGWEPSLALDPPSRPAPGVAPSPATGLEPTAPERPSAPRAAAADRATALPPGGGFEAALRTRLAREARRQGIDRPLLQATPFGFDDTDDVAVAESGRRAGRAILRSLRGALDDHLTTAARDSGSFGALFRFLDARAGVAVAPNPADAATIDGSAPRPAADFGFRFRIDAHPRVVLGGRVGKLEGRLELPLLEREVRMSVEHPLGGLGAAALRAGRSEDRGSWADLSLSLRF